MKNTVTHILLCGLIMFGANARRKAPAQDEPVIVVGGGLAGLCAVIEAHNHGSNVILIDGEKQLGGNSAKASSGISASETDTQRKLGIVDTNDRFYADTLSAGDRENDAALVDVLVHESANAVEFLQNLGVDLGDVNLCGGHSVARTHWIPSPKEGKPLPVGFMIMKTLKEQLNKLNEEKPDSIQILTETKVVGLTSWNEYITGVRVVRNGRNEEIYAKAVVLTTGGYSADKGEDASLLMEFAPEKASFPTTNGGFARGDGVKMARAMGAATVDMNRVQIHPTAFVDPAAPEAMTKFLAAEALRGKGAILINNKGVRFGNELGRRDYMTGRIMKECTPFTTFQSGSGGRPAAVMIMNDESADAFGRPAFNFYANIKKFFTKYDSAASLAKAADIDVAVLEKTLDEYNSHVETHKKDKWEKSVFPVAFKKGETLYAALITPAIHYTMGGLKIDKKAFVFNEVMGTSFKGLLAAGEVTGGVHGSNRLAGNSLLECVVYGRIAGRNAADVNYTHQEL